MPNPIAVQEGSDPSSTHDNRYLLAQSILNNLVGTVFSELRKAREEGLSPSEVARLKVAFQEAFDRRERLKSATDEELQEAINELGPVVRANQAILAASQDAVQ